MVELRKDALTFAFPDVHPDARLTITFLRTLRIPDDDKTYPLPPGFESFPLRHVDDFAPRVPDSWIEHGGVMMPMYQSEAMWINFSSSYVKGRGSYPMALKVAAGKINAISGETWCDGIHRSPQDYAVVPGQPWLDGFCVEKGIIRQFVAMPLGAGYSAEEQLTNRAQHGGVQIIVHPMKRDVFERRFPKREESEFDRSGLLQKLACTDIGLSGMALAPGGRMRQEIYEDEFDLSDWDLGGPSRCFVHIANSLTWREITGAAPPTAPPTAKEYERHGLPWFEYYGGDQAALEGASNLSGLKSVTEMGQEKGDVPLPENQSVDPRHITPIRRETHRVREGDF